MDPRFYRKRWPTIRRWLASQYLMSEAQFQRCAPWAEREWRRLSEESRESERMRRLHEEMMKGSETAIMRYRQLVAKAQKARSK